MYAASKDGWHDEQKKEEMRGPEARYLIARSASDPSDLKGFLLFQMTYEETMDDDKMAAVAYCYELQLVPEARNQGLGEYLMQLLVDIGHHWGMEKVMLTVFKANKSAIRFYTKKLGFDLDEISPGACLSALQARKFDYEILSKPC
ncbi:acyl-CoA N-acyltransferase [Radiomyces spectabilis]|uniref:acyl-CoA N-acyltransferase n=1 Tax=Radiomyces spectabilis TaxID=64574 RepID=UPI00221F78D1|nr:acyl-CoA N-acyltransferase [Radiomyces spectabilis]KAI8381307.1 acyl-CoA N-acyltransferase [Radiomyces spectabilis]